MEPTENLVELIFLFFFKFICEKSCPRLDIGRLAGRLGQMDETRQVHTGEASWIDEGEEIPESDTTFGQTMLSAYKLGTMIKISNELLNDSAFDLATYIARRFGVRMGNAEERAFITGDGVGKPLGLLAETGGAKVGVTAAQKDAVSFDEIFKLYYALKAPYRKKAQFLCNEALVLQLMTIKDNNGNYIWKPGLEIGKPDTLLNRPLKTSAFMPEIKGGSKVMALAITATTGWLTARTVPSAV